MNEIIKILNDLINEKSIQLDNYIKKENYNKFFADSLNSEIQRLYFINDFLLNKEKKTNSKQLNDLQILTDKIKKFELICLIFGIDNFNYFQNYTINNLIDMLKDFRNNNMIRIPVTLNCNSKIYKTEICKETKKYILKKP
jgi:hypothetical protein